MIRVFYNNVGPLVEQVEGEEGHWVLTVVGGGEEQNELVALQASPRGNDGNRHTCRVGSEGIVSGQSSCELEQMSVGAYMLHEICRVFKRLPA